MSTRSDPAPFVRRRRLSPEAEAYKARLKPSVPIKMPNLSDHAAVARWRAETNALWGEDDDPQVPHQREVVGGVACLVAGPSPDSGAPVVVYAHGGGYVLGSAAVAIPITARLARTLRVVSVDYRQPPEHPFPAALNDVLAVYRALVGDEAPIALAGDSAGGALALSAAVTATADGMTPAAVVLFSPLLDHAPAHGRSDTANDERRLLASYVGGADPADPRVSPLRAELAGLQPLLAQAAAAEPLAAQALELRDRAAAAGVDVTLELWEHMWHTWHYHDLPEADQAIAEAAAFVVARTTRTG